MSSIRDHEKWLEGDFALVSQDGVRLFIDTHYLMTASPVFRDMIRDCNGEPTITFLDPTLEDSCNLALFLHLITTAELDFSLIPTALGMTDGLLNLFALMDKYDCRLPRAMALNYLRVNPDEVTPLQLFTVGANLDHISICAEALQPNRFPGSHYLRDALNPRSMPLTAYQRIPPKYMWALNNAWGDFDDKAAEEVFKVQTRFKRQIVSQRPVSPPPKPMKPTKSSTTATKRRRA